MNIFDLFRKKDINEGVIAFRKTVGAVLLDVRTAEEYAGGHIEGSINLPLSDIDKAESIIKNYETPVYVHCLSGVRSAKAASALKRMGYKNVSNIGGINSYRGKII